MKWLIFVLGAVVFWGMYGPALHTGQVKLGNPMRALLCVGFAYFLMGILVPVALLARGHILVEGVPGLAKTMAIKTMAASIELRVPFLDHKVIEFSRTLSDPLKLKNGVGKLLLRRAFGPLLPERTLHRSKMGFTAPHSHWLRTAWRKKVLDLIEGVDHRSEGMFDPGALRGVLEEHVEGRVDHTGLLWSFVVWESWHRQFIRATARRPNNRH